MQINNIQKSNIATLGYGFIKNGFVPKGKDEYYLRNIQNRSGIAYRHLSAFEIEVLVRNRNTSDDWNKILVSDAFNPELVKNCQFHGLVRIGKLEPYCLSFSDLKIPVGLYNSTIISCDFEDNVVVNNVNYLSHYIIGSEAIISNVNELVTTNHAKFGNGIVKEGEEESIRIWMEVCNENTGRAILPVNEMLPGDAWIWSKYKDDELLQQKLIEITERQFSTLRGYYGKIGNRTVIKNCNILKDVWIGSDAYIKGANKLKNITINSGKEGRTQIGEGCELVNGVVGFGCRIFYGAKAVRFVMAAHSQLKYGARLINSYLGNNATISCCEVLNSLIFPAHEQHHNNSFLCAATILGQSNIAAGATIGSNHNSRSNDGEIIAGRGFWPGLCVSLKHNSRFASFTIIAKGDYPSELDIPLPFSLVSNDVANDQLTIVPAYWFMYNMYGLERNAWKYIDRDKRIERFQLIEYDYLAPDTINEMLLALDKLAYFTGLAYFKKEKNAKKLPDTELISKGKELLESNDPSLKELEIVANGFENSKRKTVIVKVAEAYVMYKKMILLYGANTVLQIILDNQIKTIQTIRKIKVSNKAESWLNIGGQLMTTKDLEVLKSKIKTNRLKTWEQVHAYYEQIGAHYYAQKANHALVILQQVTGLKLKTITPLQLSKLLSEALTTKEWMCTNVHDSRAKDYANPFRKMVYDNLHEMNKVIGKLEDNSFIILKKQELKQYQQRIGICKKQLKLK